MPRLIVCLSLWLALSRISGAQSLPYNPYAPQNEDPSPTRADGKLNWPSFFKSEHLHDKYQSYAALGSCVGTAKDVVNLLRSNRVDVNQLAEGTVRCSALRVQGGVIAGLSESGAPVLIVTHPAGVSQIGVAGQVPATFLRPGMFVRLAAQVDEHGTGHDPIKNLEVVTPAPDELGRGLESGRRQTIIAQVLHLRGRHLQLRLEEGHLRRLSFLLDDDPVVTRNGSQLNLISIGDAVTAVGHIYHGEGVSGAQVVFAATVEAATALAESDKPQSAHAKITRK